MQLCKFVFDDGPAFDGFAHGTTWNGFDNDKLVTSSVTVADHFVNCNAPQDYQDALKRATDVAALRRHVHTIVVQP